MELREERVLEKFRLYSGEEGTEEKRWALCQALCAECREWVKGQAHPGTEAGREALEGLAAAEAFYQLVLLDEALAPASISLPEVKLELQNRADKALRLAEEKRKACGPLLREQGFYFGRA